MQEYCTKVCCVKALQQHNTAEDPADKERKPQEAGKNVKSEFDERASQPDQLSVDFKYTSKQAKCYYMTLFTRVRVRSG